MFKISRKLISRSSATFLLDTIAGLTAAAVVIPKAMAYATVAGLPVEVGLFTACLPVPISAPVLTSFKSGVGLVHILDQASKIFGLHIEKRGFFLDVFSSIQHMSEASVLRCVVLLTALHNPYFFNDPLF